MSNHNTNGFSTSSVPEFEVTDFPFEHEYTAENPNLVPILWDMIVKDRAQASHNDDLSIDNDNTADIRSDTAGRVATGFTDSTESPLVIPAQSVRLEDLSTNVNRFNDNASRSSQSDIKPNRLIELDEF